ncbi:hypothetical protein N0V93_008156 [Gnomoniopsis smithogilvyi]|uniref:Thymocyte nuclear protein 1 n=1 Tax=Gnomoniopsis smithogilvyi TaxID=1191159 RepID=A0A9W8YMN9_9PEZI|nr:hypothetical protein N0V93_008156 [Gnomoniopsis smithogilvyi]
MPKRKAPADSAEDAPPRRSTRQRTSTSTGAASAPPTPAPSAPPKSAKAEKGSKTTMTTKASTTKKGSKAAVKADVKAEQKGKGKDAAAEPPTATKKKTPAKTAETKADTTNDTTGRQYWLMKAEPETRYENGVDVSFSIDDLAARKEPEPWDGIRNYVARNNLRAMKKGDLAFFSHSNCKEPGIVGIMEIVREHEPDLSAHNPKSAYYDAKSTAADPKWSIVHVEFRRKFDAPVTLKEMRTHAGPGGPLADMQMMKQSRLSVSKVSGEEWAFLMGLAEQKKG